MGVLGGLGAKMSFRRAGYPSKRFFGTGTWNMVKALGRSTADALNPYTGSAYLLITGPSYRTDITSTLVAGTGTPWTTGTVTVFVHNGGATTSLRRSGYDNRTPRGAGTMQLVTPALTHWIHPPGPRVDEHTGHIGLLRLHITPEPTGWLLLVAGMGGTRAALPDEPISREAPCRHLDRESVAQVASG